MPVESRWGPTSISVDRVEHQRDHRAQDLPTLDSARWWTSWIACCHPRRWSGCGGRTWGGSRTVKWLCRKPVEVAALILTTALSRKPVEVTSRVACRGAMWFKGGVDERERRQTWWWDAMSRQAMVLLWDSWGTYVERWVCRQFSLNHDDFTMLDRVSSSPFKVIFFAQSVTGMLESLVGQRVSHRSSMLSICSGDPMRPSLGDRSIIDLAIVDLQWGCYEALFIAHSALDMPRCAISDGENLPSFALDMPRCQRRERF